MSIDWTGLLQATTVKTRSCILEVAGCSLGTVDRLRGSKLTLASLPGELSARYRALEAAIAQQFSAGSSLIPTAELTLSVEASRLPTGGMSLGTHTVPSLGRASALSQALGESPLGLLTA